jgi:hypothetical protein
VVLAVAVGGAALFLRIPRCDMLGLAALLLASASLLLGPARGFLYNTFGLPWTITARSIELRDTKGKTQGYLTAHENGASLLLRGGAGHNTLWFGPGGGEYGPSLFMGGPQGACRFDFLKDALLASIEGPNGKGKAELQFIDNEPSIILSDASGRNRIHLELENGIPLLCFSDGDGKLRVNLRLDEDGAALIFSGADGNPKVILGPDGPTLGF